MAKNLLVINVDIRETRVALIENGIIAELHLERASETRCLGNVVLGKVTRVLPGMQAAFIDVGLDKAAFLHVEDLIRPDDLDAYLSGKKRNDRGDDEHPTPEQPAPAKQLAAAAPDAAPSGEVAALDPDAPDGEAASDAAAAPETAHADQPAAHEHGAPAEGPRGRQAHTGHRAKNLSRGESRGDRRGEPRGDGAPVASPPVPVVVVPSEAKTIEIPHEIPSGEVPITPISGDVAMVIGEIPPAEPSGDVQAAAEAAVEAEDAAAGEAAREGAEPAEARESGESDAGEAGDSEAGDEDDEDDDPTAPIDGIAVDGQPPAGGTTAAQAGRRRRRRRGGRHRKDEAAPPPKNEKPAPQQHAAPAARKGKPDQHGRIHKDTPIREVVREGQEVLVQISKEPIGTKGARVTSHVSLPGRYVVYLPTVDYIGVSKRIGSDKERHRLRETIEGMKPPTGGLIIRTLAEGLTKKQLKADVGYLVRLWGEIAKKREGARSPDVLYEELDLVLRVTRDMFGDDVDKIVIDDKVQYERLVRFVEMFMPERVKDIELYAGDEPLFDAYGIEEEIQRALSRKVPLPSGGYLIIDEAEALTAIDVNTGRFVGKGSKDHEETILKTNLEAVEEIAYQLRFRNLGGLIVLDLIDMDRAASREAVRRRLEDLLQKDKAKSSVNRISDLGLIEMTRKRTRESLGRILHEPCSYCDGTGQVSAKQTIVYEILRAIRREKSSMPGYTVVVHAHPDVVSLMKGDEREAVKEAEKRYQRRIDLSPRKEYHLEQYELIGRLRTR